MAVTTSPTMKDSNPRVTRFTFHTTSLFLKFSKKFCLAKAGLSLILIAYLNRLMNRDKEELQHHTYTIPHFDILSLNEVYIQIHSSETFLTARDTLNLKPEEIDLDQATFIIHE